MCKIQKQIVKGTTVYIERETYKIIASFNKYRGNQITFQN